MLPRPAAHAAFIDETIAKVVDDSGVAQAHVLLAALYEQVEDISQQLKAIEKRGPRASVRGAAHDRRHRNGLRSDLYEAHHHIDGIHRRFPETRDPSGPRRAALARGVTSASRSRRQP
jgi:hypothetical protein